MITDTIGWILFHVLNLSVDRALLERHAPRLVAGETVVFVQASPASMGQAITVLRRAGETQPAIFAFHGKRAEVTERASDRGLERRY